MDDNKRPIISFCIPTFKRDRFVFNCVKNILQYREHDIEVIISHDATEGDRTEELLMSLKDNRIKYYRYEKRQGIALSIKNVMDKASGEFSCLLSDEDVVHLDTISVLAQIIKEIPETSIIYCSMLQSLKGEIKDYVVYKEKRLLTGNDAVKAVAFNHSYIGGVFYNNRLYESLFSNNENWHLKDELYPFEYPVLMMAMKGTVLLLPNPIITMVEVGNITHIKSINKKHPYSFECRLMTFKQRAAILMDNIGQKDFKEEMILKSFKEMLLAASIGYYRIIKNMKNQPMDGIDKVKVNKLQLINDFYNEATRFLIDGGFCFSKDGQIKLKKIVSRIRIQSYFAGIMGTKLYQTGIKLKHYIVK